MSFTDINMYVVIALTMSGAIGLTLLFVGSLITIAAAFANDKKAFAFACILVFPLSCLYCIIYREQARYPAKYVFSGIALVFVTFAMAVWIL